MDAREVLGVGPKATRAEIRRAHADLRRLVDPAQGGSAGLAALVDQAYSRLTSTRPTPLGTIDPYFVLGIPDRSETDEVKAAYRRLVGRVHPDRGGTDELFRVVDTAYDVLMHPFDTLLRRRTTKPWPRRPPLNVPFKAPPAEARIQPSKPWAWAEVTACVVAITAVVLALVLTTTMTAQIDGLPNGFLPAVAMVPQVVIAGFAIRPVLWGLRRAWTRARGNYASPFGAEPERFLAECCFDSPVHREHEDRLYRAYVRWCDERAIAGVSPWVFIEQLRTMGLLHVRLVGMDYGLWVGVRLREGVG